MNADLRFSAVPFLLTVLAGLAGLAGLAEDTAAAQVARDPGDPLDALVTVDARLQASPSGVPFDTAAASLPPRVRTGWESFLDSAGGPWKAYVDRRTGLVDFAEGAGIPFIPGAGNTLATLAGPSDTAPPDLPALEKIARSFLPRVAVPLGIDSAALALSPGRSGHPDVHLWYVDFDVIVDDLPVEGARVVLRINNGNLIQLGTENLPAPGARVPPETVSRKEALATLADYVGGIGAGDVFLDGGTVKLLPALISGDTRGLVRVWEITFRRRGSQGTWRARIDAESGRLLDFRDVNAYAHATGGVYPRSYVFNDETVLPMPFADLSTGGFTDSAGYFAEGSGAVASTLTGKYVDVNDVCGAISLSSNASGNLAFGASAGTDCATPGSGGAGNTHASRNQFYHINRAKEVGRGWLPSNAWLTASSRSTSTLETLQRLLGLDLAQFFPLRRWLRQHRRDRRGLPPRVRPRPRHQRRQRILPDNGTGEAYADITAALLLHDSCMGAGFFQSGNCGAYGDPCTLVLRRARRGLGQPRLKHAATPWTTSPASAATRAATADPAARRGTAIVRHLRGGVGPRQPRPARPGSAGPGRSPSASGT